MKKLNFLDFQKRPGSGSAWIRIGLAPWIWIRIKIKSWIRIGIEISADRQHCLWTRIPLEVGGGGSQDSGVPPRTLVKKKNEEEGWRLIV
jgi:hypothetical protein